MPGARVAGDPATGDLGSGNSDTGIRTFLERMDSGEPSGVYLPVSDPRSMNGIEASQQFVAITYRVNDACDYVQELRRLDRAVFGIWLGGRAIHPANMHRGQNRTITKSSTNVNAPIIKRV
jgi:hypothetical protein